MPIFYFIYVCDFFLITTYPPYHIKIGVGNNHMRCFPQFKWALAHSRWERGEDIPQVQT